MESTIFDHRTPTDVTRTPQITRQEAGATSITIQNASPVTSSSESSLPHHTRSESQSQSTDSERSDAGDSTDRQSRQRLWRPKLSSRKSSGTIIIPREQPPMAENEEYDDSDARAMSPRRTKDEIDKMGSDARQALEEQAQQLQDSLLEIIERVDSVKTEHEKLDSDNKFLQSYIGELMQTSKITAGGAPKNKKRGNK